MLNIDDNVWTPKNNFATYYLFAYHANLDCPSLSFLCIVFQIMATF